VFNQIELERQAVELREYLIYHTDPALGAVWTRYEEEFAKLTKKHEEEIKQEVIAERNKKWQRERLHNKLVDLWVVLAGATFVLAMLVAILWDLKIQAIARSQFWLVS
jgi:hypothetical protein